MLPETGNGAVIAASGPLSCVAAGKKASALRRSRLGNQLPGGLVQANERHFRIVRLPINIEHFFRGRYEGANCNPAG